MPDFHRIANFKTYTKAKNTSKELSYEQEKVLNGQKRKMKTFINMDFLDGPRQERFLKGNSMHAKDGTYTPIIEVGGKRPRTGPIPKLPGGGSKYDLF